MAFNVSSAKINFMRFWYNLTEQVSTEFIKNLNARDLGYDFPVNYVDIECPQHVVRIKARFPSPYCHSTLYPELSNFCLWRFQKPYLNYLELANHIAKQWIRKRLSSFSPHFLFNHEGLNHLLAFELSRYFEAQTNISDVDACDQYELACFDCLIEVNLLFLQNLDTWFKPLSTNPFTGQIRQFLMTLSQMENVYCNERLLMIKHEIITNRLTA